ncbi:hypothetical protein DACRYDRAFT_115780 [Dacryopinax primogenitus]|uniref:Cora-domain-containing protein n=1 Tax=Dacryopinax primogenitus (strain DJM 731) TaxID=1858805 RepID=M5GA45_DACPD|nr:uncharacterized protein DACRYDRAFT_115780 [Dacryopinax primogenitus]EJU02812.1 hypothetical protein DACRYDRAFT_115780 [Dacryopinax primogenitus]
MPSIPIPHYINTPIAHSSQPHLTSPSPPIQEFPPAARSGSRTPSIDGVQPVSEADFDAPGPSGPVLASDVKKQQQVVVSAKGVAIDDAQDGGESEDEDEGVVPDSPGPAERFEPLYNSPSRSPANLPAVEGNPGQTMDGAAAELDQPAQESTLSSAETQVERPSAIPGLPDVAPPPSSTPSRPNNLFRTSALKVLQMHRGSSAIQSPGAEQGVDARRDSAAEHWGHIHQECAIEVCDYSSNNASFTRLSNAGLAEFLSGRGKDRPAWAKVRWINVGGISFDVIRAIALRYDLHPLATEDVLRCGESGSRSKSDYYKNHLFLSLICHLLAPDDEPPSYDDSQAPAGEPGEVLTESPLQDTPDLGLSDAALRRRRHSAVFARARSGVRHAGEGLAHTISRDDIESSLDAAKSMRGPGDDLRPTTGALAGEDVGWSRRLRPAVPKRLSALRPHPHSHSHHSNHADPERDAPAQKAAQAHTLAKQRQWASWMNMSPMRRRKAVNQAALQELKRGAHVSVELKHIFVFLTRGGTLITFHQDADLAHFRPIKARLQHKDSLLRAQGDASLLMQSVIDLVVDRALEVVDRYHDTLLDLERQILIKPSMKTVRQLHIMSGDLTLHKRTLTPLSTMIYALRRYDLDRAVAATPEAQDGKDVKVSGFCSHQCKVYLADVYDHMEYILSSMDMFSSIAENLINFTFNIVSYETNESMRRLTVATVVFFPLTFLTGYFGMNFVSMNSLVGSDLFFWELAIPVMIVITIAFTWNDIVKRYRAFVRNRHFDAVNDKLRNTLSRTT